MKKLYREYFQKSKVFLYPLLGIKKGVKFVPIQTYISWNGYYTEDMNKFLCLYSVDINNPEFEKFEKLHLKTHPNFEEYHVIDDKNHLYVFDLSKGTIADYVESYLYPDYYWDDYSKILNINIEDLIEVGELCDIPDLKKEDLKKDFVNVELFK